MLAVWPYWVGNKWPRTLIATKLVLWIKGRNPPWVCLHKDSLKEVGQWVPLGVDGVGAMATPVFVEAVAVAGAGATVTVAIAPTEGRRGRVLQGLKKGLS